MGSTRSASGASINSGGDIAFRAGRPHPDGFNTIHGIYRANVDGSLTTIAEDDKRFVQIGFNPSMNDLGQVSFAARIDRKERHRIDPERKRQEAHHHRQHRR